MRQIAAYDARKQPDGSILLTRCINGAQETLLVKDWKTAVNWLTRPPANSHDYFTVCFSLLDFTKALFSLLSAQEQESLKKNDRVVSDNVKIFNVPARYLGLTNTRPIDENSNTFTKEELNLQALKWWVSENDPEPANALETWRIGEKILNVLNNMGFLPTKLTSPVAVFADAYLGDPRSYPTIYNFPEDKLDAFNYAEEIMRFEWRSAYKLGMFSQSHLYDISSAYPSIIINLPSTNDCQCEYSETLPKWAQWGVIYGEIDIQTEVSPIIFEMQDGTRVSPAGKFKGYFTTADIEWLTRWKVGTFKLEDGWFFKFGKVRPYRKAMNYLWPYKNHPDKFSARIGKGMMNGVSGKLDEDRADGKQGDYYNPILALMTRDCSRLKVGNFIYENKLQDDLIAVQVDSVLSSRKVEIPEDKTIGAWRYENDLPSLVLSKGNIWRPGKRPQGITYEQITAAFKAEPEKAYYQFTTESGSVRAIDLMLDSSIPDRLIENGPKCGGDILKNIYPTKAIKFS